MEITVLGKSPSWQDAGGACSGYLIREEGYSLLLDCGNGVFAKLRRVVDYVDVGAVLISHLHADHILDLVPFAYALKYSPRQQPCPMPGWPGTATPARPQLHAALGARERLRSLARCWGDEDLIETAFDLREYSASDHLVLGPFRVRFCEVPHYTSTFAVECATNGGARITFSADCGPNDPLVDFARGADVLLIEATLPRADGNEVRGHLTPREAGEHGRRAEVRRLVVTHFSDEVDPEWTREEASRGFGAPVDLAAEGAVYAVGVAPRPERPLP